MSAAGLVSSVPEVFGEIPQDRVAVRLAAAPGRFFFVLFREVCPPEGEPVDPNDIQLSGYISPYHRVSVGYTESPFSPNHFSNPTCSDLQSPIFHLLTSTTVLLSLAIHSPVIMASLPTVEPNAIWLRGAIKDPDHAAREIRKKLNKRTSHPRSSYSRTN